MALSLIPAAGYLAKSPIVREPTETFDAIRNPELISGGQRLRPQANDK